MLTTRPPKPPERYTAIKIIALKNPDGKLPTNQQIEG
jgi:hypothetical protein